MSRQDVEKLARQYADLYDLPHSLVLETVRRESTFNPKARNGPYWGLMQIRYDTAKGIGYRGPATGLLDAETNLLYGVTYLANAYMVAGGNEKRAHRLYRSGYYYEAKRKRLLAKLHSKPPVGQPEILLAAATPEPAPAPRAETPPQPKAEAEVEVAAVPLPIPKPDVVPAAVPDAAPAALPVAKPQVVLASVLPEPKLSLTYTREAEPAAAAIDAMLAPGVPIPEPKPGSAPAAALIAASPGIPAGILAALASDDFFVTEKTLSLAADIPLPRPKPLQAQARLASFKVANGPTAPRRPVQ